MFILFGWGHQTTKIFGVTIKNLCSNCNNEEYWVLQRTITWFTLFFIPVIPYSIKYFMHCPICERGIYLDNNQIEIFRPLAENNQLLIDGEITPEEHAIRLGVQLEQKTEPALEEVQPAKQIADKSSSPKFCTECGTSIIDSSKFCGKCGVKILN